MKKRRYDPPKKLDMGNRARTRKEMFEERKLCEVYGHLFTPIAVGAKERCITCGRWRW